MIPPEKKIVGRPFLPGHPGGPGRPKGSRHALSESFIAALQADFRVHGEEAIRKTREEKPAEYVKVLASLLPKEVEIKRPLEDLTDDELVNAIELIRASVTFNPEGVGGRNSETPFGKPH
jgi:hypothetical protein